jgi:hypothetical protein
MPVNHSDQKVSFVAPILQFEKNGDKTGWTYIVVPAQIASVLNPGSRKSFRVKGLLDQHPIKSVALLPMGEGDYILALNAAMRKGVKKTKGQKLKVTISADKVPPAINREFLLCLNDDPIALKHFNMLNRSHQLYFSNWINSAKTEPTKIKRIAGSVNALANGMGYGEMIRSLKKEKE